MASYGVKTIGKSENKREERSFIEERGELGGAVINPTVSLLAL